MKRARARDSSSIFYISKWVVIVVIIIVSSISFTLGYYVGKKYYTSDNDQASIVPKNKSILRNDKELHDQEIVGQERAEKQNILSQTTTQPLQDPQHSTKTKQTAVAKNNHNPHEMQKTQPPKKGTTKITYTVQAGAFKSSHEAEILKEKLAKKGYTAYIIQSESKKHENLYKVMIGKFPTRKQAEVLSLKIKKSEGLQSFVTFRTKEDVLR